MIARGLITLLGSAAVHVAALAGVLALVGSHGQPPPLFVDLTRGTPAGDERPAPPAPPRARDAVIPPVREISGMSAPPTRAASPLAPARPTEATPAPPPAFSASREAAPDQGAELPSAVAEASGSREVDRGAPAPEGPPSGTAAAGGRPHALASPGTGRGEVPPEFGPYLARFRQRIQDLVVYPLAARRRGLAGRVEVELLLEPSGRVRDIAVIASSSHGLLDEAAVEALRALPPVPLPEHLPRRPLRVRLPVIFQLH